MHRFRTALVGAGVLALVAATLTPLATNRADAAPGPAPALGAQLAAAVEAGKAPSAEELEALDQAAAESGEQPWGVQFSLFIDRVKDEFPEDFGAAEVNTDQESGWIIFKNAIPGGAKELFAELPGIELRGDLGLSEEEISALVDLIFQSLVKTYGNDFHVAVIPVPRDREIVAEYVPSATGPTAAESIEDSMRAATAAVDLGGFSLRGVETEDGVVAEILGP